MNGPDVPTAAPLLEVQNLTVEFGHRSRFGRGTVLRAVDGISFTLARGEILGLVGESGSGKSTTGRAIVQVQRMVDGDVRLHGRSLTRMSGREMHHSRRAFQMVFQDPEGSLNPRHRVAAAIAEPMDIHGMGTVSERRARVAGLLERVGLSLAYARRYPHQLSGGQLQRVAIARALSAAPEFVVCDEPVSALDVSIQAQIVNLLKGLRDDLGLALLFIAHDLAVVRYVADRVAVMYLGRIVEIGSAEQVYGQPRHPYTVTLLSAVPVPDVDVERARNRVPLRGEIPNPADPPSGCRFRTRCPWSRDRCTEETPVLRDIGGGHRAACHFAEEIADKAQPVVPNTTLKPKGTQWTTATSETAT